MARTPGRLTGRPTALTPEVLERVVLALASGAPDWLAAQAVGVRPNTFSEWRGRGEKARELREAGERVPDRERIYMQLLDEIDTAMARVEVGALAAIQRAARDGDWRAAAWLAERTAPDRWQGRKPGGQATGEGSRMGIGGRPVGAVSSPDRKARPDEPPRLSLVREDP